MAYNNNILLGRITKVSGYEGAVTVKLEKIFTENIPQMESVFLEIEGRPVPFFISGLEYSGADILKLWFEGYNSIEKISEFTGCRIFLTTGISDNNQNDDNQNLIGYLVFAQEDKLLGSITRVIPNNGQWLLNVISPNKKDLLIPFQEHFIVSIDKRKKIIVMDLPEGLTEIN
ncbi:MAG: ribosome maturation factor RimM [Bacteroidia bacterium]|nr:ribosome maturation factor RimM [Bacteroidia bacterium]